MRGFSLPVCCQGNSHEANVPTLRRPSQAHARFSRAHAHPRRPGGDPCASREGALAARRRLTLETHARQRLRREQRLGTAAVAAALKGGKVIRAARFHLYRLPSSFDYPRLALVVPKRLAPRAVTRNRSGASCARRFVCNGEAWALDCVVADETPGDTPVTREEIEARPRGLMTRISSSSSRRTGTP
jgi:hypothetical protein